MAKQKSDTFKALAEELICEVEQGQFRLVYLLMGEDSYYPEKVCDAVIAHCIAEEDKDFNETICYGGDVSSEMVVDAARRYPMMAERQLVVVKDAQRLDNIENLAAYCEHPLDSTVLVILMRNAKADKRRQLFKSVEKNGVVLESSALRDYQVGGWIIDYYRSRGMEIDPRAAQLLGEYAGTNLGTIEVETDKLLKNLPEGATRVSVDDIERNVGISRQFSIFELNSALSARDAARSMRIAHHVGTAAKFAMPPAISAMFTHFQRILRYSAALASKQYLSSEEKAQALPGVNPYFYKEYEQAARNYSLSSCMNIISLLCEYDYRGKGGDGGDMDNASLLKELTLKILSS